MLSSFDYDRFGTTVESFSKSDILLTPNFASEDKNAFNFYSNSIQSMIAAEPPQSYSPTDSYEDSFEDDNHDFDIPQRNWTIMTSIFPEKSVIVKMRTRRQEFSDVVPERIYSSLVYDIRMSLDGKGVLIDNHPISSILLLKLQMVNASDLSNFEKHSKVLLKNPECALQKDPNSPFTFVGKLKFQINPKIECAYHKTRKEFKFLLTVNAEKNDIVVLRMQSPICKIFARYPDKKRKRTSHPKIKPNKKKKLHREYKNTENMEKFESIESIGRVGGTDNSEIRINGRVIITHESSATDSMLQFEYHLNDICEFYQRLNPELRERCFVLFSNKISEMYRN